MATKSNAGAITIRAPKEGPDRDAFIQAKELLTAEVERNKAAGEGPRSIAAIFREMAEHRYAAELAEQKADDARVEAETKGEETPALPDPSALF